MFPPALPILTTATLLAVSLVTTASSPALPGTASRILAHAAAPQPGHVAGRSNRPWPGSPDGGHVSDDTASRPASRFSWPLRPHRVVRGFAPPAVRWGRGHRGVDLSAAVGSDVIAPADGVVTFSGVLAGRGVLSIRHPEGFSTTYEPVSDRVPKGTIVRRGQRVGRLDSGHCAETACLHWGYRVGRDEYRNPLVLVGAQMPVLLPPVNGS